MSLDLPPRNRVENPEAAWLTTQVTRKRQSNIGQIGCGEQSTDPQALLSFYRREAKLTARDLDHR